MKAEFKVSFEGGKEEEFSVNHDFYYFDAIMRALKIAGAKNEDYAGEGKELANIMACEEVGVPAEYGVMVRLSDKWSRLQNFFKKGKLAVEDEKVEDTILDMINYLAILYAVLKRKEKSASP